MWVSLQGIGSKGDTKTFGNNFNLLPNVLVRKVCLFYSEEVGKRPYLCSVGVDALL